MGFLDKAPSWQKGNLISAAKLQQIKTAMISSIQGGRGILVKQIGNKIIIDSLVLPTAAHITKPVSLIVSVATEANLPTTNTPAPILGHTQDKNQYYVGRPSVGTTAWLGVCNYIHSTTIGALSTDTNVIKEGTITFTNADGGDISVSILSGYGMAWVPIARLR